MVGCDPNPECLQVTYLGIATTISVFELQALKSVLLFDIPGQFLSTRKGRDGSKEKQQPVCYCQ